MPLQKNSRSANRHPKKRTDILALLEDPERIDLLEAYAKWNLEIEEEGYLDSLDERTLVTFMKEHIQWTFYVAAVLDKEEDIAEIEPEFNAYVVHHQLNRFSPESAEAIWNVVVSSAMANPSAILLSIPYRDTDVRIDLVVLNEIEVDAWCQDIVAIPVPSKKFFAKRLFDVFKDNQDEILDCYVQQRRIPQPRQARTHQMVFPSNGEAYAEEIESQ